MRARLPRASTALLAGLGLPLVCGTSAHARIGPPPPPTVINEIRTGQPGPDTDEYFELHGTPGASLDGVWYVVIGDDDVAVPPAQNGVVEVAIDLSGFSLDGSGYFVFGEPTLSIGTPDATGSLNFEDNDNVTHLLVTGFVGAVGADLDLNNDGVLDVQPWSSLLDAVALVVDPTPDGVTADRIYTTITVGPDGPSVPQHVYRCVDSTWEIGSAAIPGQDTVGGNNPLCGSQPIATVLNEVRIDEPGADNDEYFEIKGEPGTDLNDLTLIVLGDGTGGSGVIEAVVSLAGQSIGASGYFTVSESTNTLGTPDLVAELNFENSDNVTFLLVSLFGGANGDDLDTDDDGVLDSTPWAEIVDSVALVTPTLPPAGGEYAYSPNLVGPDGSFVPGQAYRCEPTGTWTVGVFNLGDTDTFGTANPVCAALPCGAAGTGSCFVEHENPSCDFADCCNAVCAIDPSCCDASWDAECATLAFKVCTAAGPAPVLSFNEIRIGQSGTDLDEYVEIAGAPGTSLSGVALIAIGDGASPNGVVESAGLLTGTIPESGLFVVSKSTFTLGTPNQVDDSLNFEDSNSVTHLLVFNFTGSVGEDLDADEDCTLDSTPWDSTIDAIGLTATDGLCLYADVSVGPDGAFSPAHAYKCSPDGTWTVGSFESTDNDTPGFENYTCAPIDPCGAKGAGDCLEVQRTPGCADADCCNAVCALDPACCETAWDADCVAQAEVACAVVSEPPDVVISEIRVDQPGADNDEYFELYGTPGALLNGLTYLVIGDGAASQGSGVIEAVVSLAGQVMPEDGFFLAAESTFTLNGATPDWIVPGSNGLNFENSDNVTHMLVWEFTGAEGDDLDTDDDGVLDVVPWSKILTSVALVEEATTPPVETEWAYGDTIVGPDGKFLPGEVSYCPTANGAWTIGLFDPAAKGAQDTPGEANLDCEYTPPCPADLNGDGSVGGPDLAILLGGWGFDGPADLDGDDIVSGSDLAILLGAWGPC